MKSKRNTYILLSAVLILWGLIGYRVFASIDPPKDMKNTILKTRKFQPKKISAKVSYTIQANYRDPFMDAMEKPKKKTRFISKEKKEKIVFPNVEFKGVFSSGIKKNTVYLIMINEKQEMFKIKDIHQEVKLLYGNKEKITIKYKSEKQTIYLKSKHP